MRREREPAVNLPTNSDCYPRMSPAEQVARLREQIERANHRLPQTALPDLFDSQRCFTTLTTSSGRS